MVAGKVSSLATDVTGAKVTEQLGYTDTDVFNDATANTALRNFVQGITGLTTNTYVSATVTYEVDLDTNNPPAAKTIPTFTTSKTSFSIALAQDYENNPAAAAASDNGGYGASDDKWVKDVDFTYNGDGNFIIPAMSGVTFFMNEHASGTSYRIRIVIANAKQSGTLPKTITIGTAETATYQAATITLNFTA